jgi:peptidoglycan L-alanyl-D-glutamate endopeptidase CwlK
MVMPKFSQRSLEKLNSCHPDLVKLFNEVIKHVDCTIIEGVRTQETQIEYYRTGKSKTLNSKHLMQPDGFSHAVDAMICKIDWNDNIRNAMFTSFVRATAIQMGIKIRSGIDWDSDWQIKDHSFHDYPHFELID